MGQKEQQGIFFLYSSYFLSSSFVWTHFCINQDSVKFPFVSGPFLQKLASGDFLAKCLLKQLFGAKKSPDASFCMNGAETKVGGVLKTTRHLWIHGVIFFPISSIFEIIDTEVWQFSRFFEILRTKIP
jgi:hypothetical protein